MGGHDIQEIVYTYPARLSARNILLARTPLTFSGTLEKEPDNQNLQCRHTDHHTHFHQAEVEYSLLRAPDCAKVSVLSGSEIFLHPADRAQLAAHFENGVLQGRGLLR